MEALLAMPELWIGFGLLSATVYVVTTQRSQHKQKQARLARAVRGQKSPTAQMQESLRRKDRNSSSALGQRLASFSSTEKLRARLIMAGIDISLQRLLAIVVGLFLGTLFILCILLGKPLIMGLLFAVLIGIGSPHFAIQRKIRKRQVMFLKLFPEAIELIVRGLRAGLPVAESFITVSREIPAPVGDMFGTVSQQMQLGLPLEKALIDAALKIDLTEFNFFVTTIILQRETGGNLGEILGNLSDTLRQRQMMKLKILALSSEARASAVIIGSLPFFVFVILSFLSPDYLLPFYDDYRGNMAALGALGIIGIGAGVMHRMTQMEI